MRLVWDRNAFGIALGFFLAGVVGIVTLFLSGHPDARGEGLETTAEGAPGQGLEITPEGGIVLLGVNFVFAGVVYFVSLRKLERKPLHLCQDQLRVCGMSLGPYYRLHIMKLSSGVRPDRPFGFVAQYNMTKWEEYEGKITLRTPGVGSAYFRPKKIIIMGPDQMDRAIDTKVMHLWSIRIPHSECVLTIDSTARVSDDQVPHVARVIRYFRKTLQHYRVDSLDFLL